nr:hypothetical protein [Tanacetum cinerariifolium]
PIPADTSPATLSLGYIADSDQEEDPEEDHADYPADRGDDDDGSSDDDDEDDNDVEEDDEEEEEHPALADSSSVPVDDHVPSRARFTTPAFRIEVEESSVAAVARQPGLDTLVATLVAQTSSLQTQLTTALGRILILEVREPACTDDPEDAGSSFVLVETEARCVRQTWGHAMDCNRAVHAELQAYRA